MVPTSLTGQVRADVLLIESDEAVRSPELRYFTPSSSSPISTGTS